MQIANDQPALTQPQAILYGSVAKARRAFLRGSTAAVAFAAYYWCPNCEQPHFLGALLCPHCNEPLARKAA